LGRDDEASARLIVRRGATIQQSQRRRGRYGEIALFWRQSRYYTEDASVLQVAQEPLARES
jgi:hypothetical protein